MPRFADIIDDLTSLSLEEMEEAQRLLAKAVIEKRREQIAMNYKETIDRYKKGELTFYDNAADLLNALNEE